MKNGGIYMFKFIEPKIQLDKKRQIFTNKHLRALIIPLIIEQLLILLVGIADTLMVSYAGEATVSGVSLVNQLNTVFILVFTALASGGAVVASQYIGNKNKENGVLAASQLVMITTIISIIGYFSRTITNIIVWKSRSRCNGCLLKIFSYFCFFFSCFSNL